MSDLVIQASFNSGEWAPNLFARVDVQKYRSGAALLENFYVDYRGGASTRPGSRYVLQAYKSGTPVRLISFQAAFNVGYALEFGDHYIRFFFQGSPILETGVAITAATRANPCVITVPGHTYIVGDWIFVTGVVGMTQLNGRYFSILNVAGNNITLGTLNGANIDSTGYIAYTSGGLSQRVYTLASPYAGADLALVKFAQVQDQMVLCHPSYTPRLLTIITPTNWTIAAITFGSTATAPTGIAITTTLAAGGVNYSYVVTSIDGNGQESEPSAPVALLSKQDIQQTLGSNKLTWTPAASAVAYNVYESNISLFGIIPTGVSYGFIGTCKATTFIDTNIIPNFSETPPISFDPFTGSGLASFTVTAAGLYTTVPTVSLTGGSPSVPGTAGAVLGIYPPVVTAGGAGFVVGDTINFGNSIVLAVSTIGGGGAVTAYTIASPGNITAGATPANPIAQVSTTGAGTGATITVTWGVIAVNRLTTGAGYVSAPAVNFSAGAATATVTLGATSTGNPTVPSFFQQRLVLGAPVGAPAAFYMSKPGAYYNYDITDPVQADNSISETIIYRVPETIKSIVSSTAGMLVLTDQACWLVNGGASGAGVSPTAIVAQRQSAVGASDVPPIIANASVLHVSAKRSTIRDLAYNIYLNVFTGSDISTTSSHLFFGHTITEWAWAEAPFYVVWAVRDDGVMLTLTFLKEQEFIGWSHQITNGLYKSVCAVTELTPNSGNVDAVYTVAQRTVNGSTVQYIERIVDRAFPSGFSSAWCVDAGIQYSGAPASTFFGAEHLAGVTVTGLADGKIIAPFVMPTSGVFTLGAPASLVTVGVQYICKLQTLAIDVGQSPIQGKLKKIPHVDVRVVDTLDLQIGSDFNNLVSMKDLVFGNVSSMRTGLTTQLVSGLYTGDARTYLDPSWNVEGQYCFEQSTPYPATILGVFPCLVLGDTD